VRISREEDGFTDAGLDHGESVLDGAYGGGATPFSGVAEKRGSSMPKSVMKSSAAAPWHAGRIEVGKHVAFRCDVDALRT
jgi:hypothetical protein